MRLTATSWSHHHPEADIRSIVKSPRAAVGAARGRQELWDGLQALIARAPAPRTVGPSSSRGTIASTGANVWRIGWDTPDREECARAAAARELEGTGDHRVGLDPQLPTGSVATCAADPPTASRWCDERLNPCRPPPTRFPSRADPSPHTTRFGPSSIRHRSDPDAKQPIRHICNRPGRTCTSELSMSLNSNAHCSCKSSTFNTINRHSRAAHAVPAVQAPVAGPVPYGDRPAHIARRSILLELRHRR